MKKGFIALLTLMVVVTSGCRSGKKKNQVTPAGKNTDVRKEIDIPVAGESIKSYFDADLGEFALSDDVKQEEVRTAQAPEASKGDEYAWVERTDADGFKKIYFDFDKYDIRNDQATNLVHDVALAKAKLDEAQREGKPLPVFVIDGHACNSAGSRVYNLALSERRAKVLADQMIAQGIPQENIKIVGRGSDMPAVAGGGREHQAPNRRDELHMVTA